MMCMVQMKSLDVELIKNVVKSLYSALKALRGPDVECDELKFIFTCRIRHLLGLTSIVYQPREDPRVGLAVILNVLKFIFDESRTRSELYALRHYLETISIALTVMNMYKLISDDEYDFLHNLCMAYICAINYLLHNSELNFDYFVEYLDSALQSKFVVGEEA